MTNEVDVYESNFWHLLYDFIDFEKVKVSFNRIIIFTMNTNFLDGVYIAGAWIVLLPQRGAFIKFLSNIFQSGKNIKENLS